MSRAHHAVSPISASASAPSAHTTLAELAATLPSASRVFARHRLDYCCHGRRPLAEACAERGLAPESILEAIAREGGHGAGGEAAAWGGSPLPSLIQHIVGHYHERLREELPALIALAEKVERVHAERPSVPRGLAALLADVHADVLAHLEKEERVLFPMISAGFGARAGGPVQVMEAEHVGHGDSLARIRALTGDLIPPDDACATWRALYLRLGAFESELMEHIHLENNVLFPRALCG